MLHPKGNLTLQLFLLHNNTFSILERNRRVAKAYARAPVLTVNGSDDGFDGFRIGKFTHTNNSCPYKKQRPKT